MAILTMFEVHGDPDEICALKEEKIAPQAKPLAAQNGGLAQIVVKTDDGRRMTPTRLAFRTAEWQTTGGARTSVP